MLKKSPEEWVERKIEKKASVKRNGLWVVALSLACLAAWFIAPLLFGLVSIGLAACFINLIIDGFLYLEADINVGKQSST